MSKIKKTKRFLYPLESVLKVRDIREKQEQDKYKKAEELAKKELEQEEKLKTEQAMQYQQLLDMMTQKTLPDVTYIKLRKAHLEGLKEKVEEQVKVRQEAEKKRDDQRDVLLKASKDKKIMEKDKEKSRLLWKKLIDKEEVKFLDDIAAIGFNKKGSD